MGHGTVGPTKGVVSRLREDSKVIFAPLFHELLQLSHNELGQVVAA